MLEVDLIEAPTALFLSFLFPSLISVATTTCVLKRLQMTEAAQAAGRASGLAVNTTFDSVHLAKQMHTEHGALL